MNTIFVLWHRVSFELVSIYFGCYGLIWVRFLSELSLLSLNKIFGLLCQWYLTCEFCQEFILWIYHQCAKPVCFQYSILRIHHCVFKIHFGNLYFVDSWSSDLNQWTLWRIQIFRNCNYLTCISKSFWYMFSFQRLCNICL